MFVSFGEHLFLACKLTVGHSFQIAHDLLSSTVKVI